MNPGYPVSLFIGRSALLPGESRPSAIVKHPVQAPLWLGPEGFAGDEQADRRVHGGPEKAVHLYPAAHYPHLAARFPDLTTQLVPGALGENLSVSGLTEDDMILGDIFSLGEAVLQLSQPRVPCWKIDSRFAHDGVAVFIAESGLCGWYWRVLQPGRVAPGDHLSLQGRTAGAPSLGFALATLRGHRPSLDAMEQILAAPALAPLWREKIAARLNWLRQADQ